MFRSLIFVCALVPLVSLASIEKSVDSQFEELASQFIAEYLEMNPEVATSLGEHKYDNRLNDYSQDGVKKTGTLAKRYLESLDRVKSSKLGKFNNVDFRILKENLEYTLFRINTLREYEWNPLSYNIGSAIDNLISRDFAPLKDRLANVKQRLLLVPQVVAAAKANLKSPPRIYTETAIQQNTGVISLIDGDLQRFAEQAQLKEELAPAQDVARSALIDYGKWLKEELLPRSEGAFRLGKEKFDAKLKFALSSDMSRKEILKRAQKDLKTTQNRMFEVAQKISRAKVGADRKAFIKSVLDQLALERPNNDTIVRQAEDNLKDITTFVRAQDFVTIPTEPLKVIVMPEYARGTSIAYFYTAGPFEKKNEAVYAISPTPKDWSAERTESFYKEYNNYMLQNLTIHEAIPGHYLQIMHSNRFKAPTQIRALFGSGSFVEGWAVYSEQLMAEKGFGGPKVEIQQLKMKLRVITNAIIDQKIHVDGMTEKEAVDLMMAEGFQEEGEAVGKWKRAQLSSTQLSTYFVGVSEINDIRNAYETKTAGTINLKSMHDEMLSFGSPPAKYVMELMGLRKNK